MAPKVLIKRTATPNLPPTSLQPGELSVEMVDPVRLWVGVPTAIDPAGKRLLIDRSTISSSAAIFIGDTPPPSPAPGQLWWESDTGFLFLYYDDGNTKQWVACTVPGQKGKDGTNGTNGISSAILTAVSVATTAVFAINSAAAVAGLITEGIEVLSAPIVVKSATSKLRLRGGVTPYAVTAIYVYAGLYTNLATAPVASDRGYLSPSAALTSLNPVTGLVAHGQPVGATITCSMRVGRASTAVVPYVNASGAAAPFVPPTNAWLEAEEVT
jgi:hypothetical protein